MEIDIKLRQQELSSKQKVVSFDSNNNNSALSNNEEDSFQKQTSEEDWRSLSPNEEIPKNDIDYSEIDKKRQQRDQQQVSAKLICEKLRDYQATDEATLAERRAEKLHRSNVATKNAMQLKGKHNGFYSNDLDHDNRDQKLDDNKRESGVRKNANGQNEEIQPMSIDPTLCHSSENINNITNSNCKSNKESSTLPASSINQTSQANAEETSITDLNEREEQTVNEEFTSSNSSFGPMSMSMPRQIDSLSDSQDLVSNNQDQESDTEDEPNSAQSGSVLTVINAKLDQNQDTTNKNTPSLNDNQKNSSWNGSSIDQNTLTSEINDQEIGEGEGEEKGNGKGRKGNRQDQDQEGDIIEDEQEEEGEEEEVEGGSNIGVAFESLHFDNDIKSSKQEQVDDELLIAPSPVKRPSVSKFNAKEVRSVCNFISAAVSDATRQVENFINPKSNNQLLLQTVMREIGGDNDEHSKDNADNRESTQNSSSNSIQRATFVCESSESINSSPLMNKDQELLDINQSSQVISDQAESKFKRTGLDLDGKGEEDVVQRELQNIDDLNEFEDEVPTADLSSIFEANVRREIERFETNATIKKSNGCKYANKNTLTEWRIAEEIRLFNAREMELKKRLKDTSRSYGGGSGSGDGGGAGDTNNSLSGGQQQTNNVVDLKSSQARQSRQNEAIFRFGKTLQIPKASSIESNSSSSNSSSSYTSMNNLGKSIKLSTTATSSLNTNGNCQQTTMISMHKFIASGGKRFVFTNTNTSPNQNFNNTASAVVTTASTLQNSLFTKSMSNLSISATNTNKTDLQSRVVDYKAVDSLKCKETPNVKPGIARKVIETFSRMQSSQDSLSSRINESQQSNVPATPTLATATATTMRHHLQSKQQHQMSSSSSLSISAEWKIQEELREMRAREAELRDQRSQMINSSLQISHNNQDDPSSTLLNGGSLENHLNVDLVTSGKQTTDDEQQLHKEPLSSGFSSECLYPIKQTIDSFRKLNSSSQQTTTTTNNKFANLAHQNNNYSAKVQRKPIQTRTEQQNNVPLDDYVSK